MFDFGAGVVSKDEGKYVLDSDTSDKALELVLQQEQEGELNFIAYASRELSAAERSYCTTRKELLAIIYRLKHFRQFLLGRRFSLDLIISNTRACWTTS